jgi:SAM-dependent methyltransferase
MKVDFDKYTEDYNQLLKRETAFFSPNEAYFAEYKVRLARRLVDAQPNRIWEFGCGIGRNLRFICNYFPSAEVFGSDVSAKSLDIARSENPEVYFWDEGNEGLAQTGFDMIFVAGVFHHIPLRERKSTAKELFSRLDSGGVLVMFEHNPYNPVTRHIVNNCPYDEDAVLLNPAEMCTHLEQAGFRIRKYFYTLFFPPSLKLLARLEDRLGWLPLGGQYCVYAVKE